jgi:hypothetical protein
MYSFEVMKLGEVTDQESQIVRRDIVTILNLIKLTSDILGYSPAHFFFS